MFLEDVAFVHQNSLDFRMFCVLFNMIHLVIHLLNKDAEVFPKLLANGSKFCREAGETLACGDSNWALRFGRNNRPASDIQAVDTV